MTGEMKPTPPVRVKRLMDDKTITEELRAAYRDGAAAERAKILAKCQEPPDFPKIFRDAFRAWFMNAGVDFWMECDADEELAWIAARALADEIEKLP